MAKKGHGAPIGNHNAAGPHSGHGYGPNTPGHSSRFKSGVVGAALGPLDGFGHAILNNSTGNAVHSGSHAVGAGLGYAAIGGVLGGSVGGVGGAAKGAALGMAYGGTSTYLASKAGKYMSGHYKKK